jgi:hypothetical protein
MSRAAVFLGMALASIGCFDLRAKEIVNDITKLNPIEVKG